MRRDRLRLRGGSRRRARARTRPGRARPASAARGARAVGKERRSPEANPTTRTRSSTDPVPPRRDRQRIAVVVVLVEEARASAPAGAVDGRARRRARRRRGQRPPARTPAPQLLTRAGRLPLRVLQDPVEDPVDELGRAGVENLFAISSASSMTTGRGVEGSCSSSKRASRRMLRSTIGIRASLQWSACFEMIASSSSRLRERPRDEPLREVPHRLRAPSGGPRNGGTSRPCASPRRRSRRASGERAPSPFAGRPSAARDERAAGSPFRWRPRRPPRPCRNARGPAPSCRRSGGRTRSAGPSRRGQSASAAATAWPRTSWCVVSPRTIAPRTTSASARPRREERRGPPPAARTRPARARRHVARASRRAARAPRGRTASMASVIVGFQRAQTTVRIEAGRVAPPSSSPGEGLGAFGAERGGCSKIDPSKGCRSIAPAIRDRARRQPLTANRPSQLVSAGSSPKLRS